jgi:hypothetical protein
MGKNKKKTTDAPKDGKLKIKKVVEIDAVKKEKAFKIIGTILESADFPKVAPDAAKISKQFEVPEKKITFVCKRLEALVKSLASKSKKKSKSLEKELEINVQDITSSMASVLAAKDRTVAKFVRVQVTKQSSKKNKNACGKAHFSLGNGKDVYLYWEYREGQIYSGGVLHELTKEE